ncbi:MAG: zinc ribbon domain-containing protein [Candidatus Alcyoniella australis]|nr:zinc ribbon domain-containing protein [Candidatus Alcyoniella australis]
MPLYEYKCKECGLEFDELVSLSKRDQVRCPKCQGDPERKLSGFVSSGGGGGLSSSSCSSGPTGFS